LTTLRNCFSISVYRVAQLVEQRPFKARYTSASQTLRGVYNRLIKSFHTNRNTIEAQPKVKRTCLARTLARALNLWLVRPVYFCTENIRNI